MNIATRVCPLTIGREGQKRDLPPPCEVRMLSVKPLDREPRQGLTRLRVIDESSQLDSFIIEYAEQTLERAQIQGELRCNSSINEIYGGG